MQAKAALTSIRRSRTSCFRRFAEGAPSSLRPSPLTPRETEILRFIADGHANTEIADTLHLGLGTVKGHIRDILEKLSASDRTQAAVVALKKGYI